MLDRPGGGEKKKVAGGKILTVKSREIESVPAEEPSDSMQIILQKKVVDIVEAAREAAKKSISTRPLSPFSVGGF